jgi:hypothetical protein
MLPTKIPCPRINTTRSSHQPPMDEAHCAALGIKTLCGPLVRPEAQQRTYHQVKAWSTLGKTLAARSLTNNETQVPFHKFSCVTPRHNRPYPPSPSRLTCTHTPILPLPVVKLVFVGTDWLPNHRLLISTSMI